MASSPKLLGRVFKAGDQVKVESTLKVNEGINGQTGKVLKEIPSNARTGDGKSQEYHRIYMVEIGGVEHEIRGRHLEPI